MSAFLVDKETIDRIITGLDYELRQDRYLQIKMDEMTGINYKKDGWKDALGQEMFEMNMAALVARYDDKAEKLSYSYYPRPATNIQYLKSLQCFNYQCAEGDIPSLPIYKFFDNLVERKFMTRIIYSMPEYDQAQWA